MSAARASCWCAAIALMAVAGFPSSAVAACDQPHPHCVAQLANAPHQGGKEKTSASPVPWGQMLRWKLGMSRLGAIKVGMTVREVRLATGRPMIRGYGFPSCQSWTVAGAPGGLGITTAFGRVARIDIRHRRWQTVRGVHVGDRSWQVRRRYGVREERHAYTRGRYLITRGKHRLVFETSSTGKVTRFRAGRRPHVEYIEGCV